MQFVITALDGENMLEKRMAIRPLHLQNMQRFSDHVLAGGGLLDQEGRMNGTVIVCEYESRQDLDAYLSSEPYILENVWKTVDVRPMQVQVVDRKPYKG